MTKRLNITLPEETVRLINRVASRGERSRLIDQAVNRYVKEAGRSAIRRHLEEGARARADRDLRIAEEWFALDDDQPDLSR